MKQLGAGFIRKFRIIKTRQPVHAVRVRAALPMTEHHPYHQRACHSKCCCIVRHDRVLLFFPVHNNLLNCQKAFSPGLYSPAQPYSAMAADK